MSLSFNNVGINLSGAKIQVVEVANEGDKFYINRIDEEFFSELLDFNFKEAKIIEILQQAFNEILLRGEFLGKNVTVALPPEIFKIFNIPSDARLSQADFLSQLKWEFSKLFPYENADDFLLRSLKLRENSENKSVELSVLALKREIIKTLAKFFSINNLNIIAIDCAPLAALNVFRTSAANVPDSFLAVFLSSKSLSGIFVKDRKPIFINTLPLKNIGEAKIRLNSIFESASSVGLNKSDYLQGFIFGEGVSNTLLSTLNEALETSLVAVNPFSFLPVAEHVNSSPLYTEKYNSFTAACGIALRLD